MVEAFLFQFLITKMIFMIFFVSVFIVIHICVASSAKLSLASLSKFCVLIFLASCCTHPRKSLNTNSYDSHECQITYLHS